MIRSIEHIAVLAADPVSLAHWYCDTLGFKVISADDASGKHFIGLPEGGILEILRANDKERPEQRSNDAGIRHIAFIVDDYNATAKSLEERGVTFISPHPAPTSRDRLNFFPDPEGNILQLACRAQPLG